MSFTVNPGGGPVIRDAVKAVVPIPCRGIDCDGVIPVKKNFDVKEVVKCPKCSLLHGFANTTDGVVYGTCL